MSLEICVPGPQLSRHVAMFWHCEGYKAPHAFERVLPTGTVQMAEFRGPIDESHLHSSAWIEAYWLSMSVADYRLLQMLAAIPTGMLKRSSTKGPTYRYTIVDALCSSLDDRLKARKHLAKALQMAGKVRKDFAAVEIPKLHMLDALLGDGAQFEQYLSAGLVAHKKYWTANDQRRQDMRGLVAVDLTGLALWRGNAAFRLMCNPITCCRRSLLTTKGTGDASLINALLPRSRRYRCPSCHSKLSASGQKS